MKWSEVTCNFRLTCQSLAWLKWSPSSFPAGRVLCVLMRQFGWIDSHAVGKQNSTILARSFRPELPWSSTTSLPSAAADGSSCALSGRTIRSICFTLSCISCSIIHVSVVCCCCSVCLHHFLSIFSS